MPYFEKCVSLQLENTKEIGYDNNGIECGNATKLEHYC